MTDDAAAASGAERALDLPDLRRFLAFRFLFSSAIQMQGVLVGWHVYEVTQDELALGLVGLAEVVAHVTTSPVGGHYADRHDRRGIVLFCASVYVVCAALLWGVEAWSASLARPDLWIYAIIFATGISRGFIGPAIQALFAQIVPRKLILDASTWSANVWHVAAVAGPAVAGLIAGYASSNVAWALLFGLASVSLYFLASIHRYPAPVPDEREDLWSSLTTGVRFVFAQPVLRGALALDLVAVLFGGAVAMLPVFAKEILHTGPEGLGFLRAAPFAGSIVMGLALARWWKPVNAGRELIVCVAGFGACMSAFALSENLFLSLFLLFLSGVFDTVSVVVRSSTVQLLTPDAMRGRVSAVNSIFIGASNELGAFESGAAARLLGLVPSVVIGGGISILAAVVAAVTTPELRRLNLDQLSKSSD
jgi:MFS family permease